MTSRREAVFTATGSLIFGLSTAILAAAGAAGSLFFLLTDHPYRAVILLAAVCILLGLARVLGPPQPWFASRHRWLDVVAYVSVGSALIFLAPWVAATAV